MAILQNIYGSPVAIGPQGMTGFTYGLTGPKGLTGPTGVQGPQGMTGGDIYGLLMKRYENQQFNMIWEMKNGEDIKIKDMEDSHVRNCINMLRRNTLNDSRKAWIEIFTDVIVKRRRFKLEKIKSKIDANIES